MEFHFEHLTVHEENPRYRTQFQYHPSPRRGPIYLKTHNYLPPEQREIVERYPLYTDLPDNCRELKQKIPQHLINRYRNVEKAINKKCRFKDIARRKTCDEIDECVFMYQRALHLRKQAFIEMGNSCWDRGHVERYYNLNNHRNSIYDFYNDIDCAPKGRRDGFNAFDDIRFNG